ncbi:DUF72 domain-containing protein [Undibacterium sp. TJN25]|uniref:DUF72 domain-containing protein n=1 Tax=Undibacterium sp. TJN25 TaxID=3413056 RepID=UPI003BF079AD
MASLYLGCAGWSVPRQLPDQAVEEFPVLLPFQQQLQHQQQAEHDKSHLQRYAELFSAVEINTSFYRSHMPATYERWRLSVPAGFRFSVKLPRTVTHLLRLANCDHELNSFVKEVAHLREKLGCLLIQLPPSLQFEPRVAGRFIAGLRQQTDAPLALEPRHPTWFGPDALELIQKYRLALVQADPQPPGFRDAELPDASPLVYHRLHGSPDMYYSAYSSDYLDDLQKTLAEQQRQGKQVWCIFDNTAQGAAFWNALLLASFQAHR